MKKCPQCSRLYDDDELNFCLDDGRKVSGNAPAQCIATQENHPLSQGGFFVLDASGTRKREAGFISLRIQ
jgi:hypothetical protein